VIAPAVNRVIWIAAALWTALLLASFYFHDLGPAASLLFCAFAVLSAFRPYEALLVVFALAPLSTILFVVLRIPTPGVRVIEAIVLAHLTGWAAHGAIRARPPFSSSALRWCAAALLTAALASGIVSAAVMFAQQGTPGTIRPAADWLRGYAVALDPVTFAFMFAEGVLLMLAVADLCAGRDDRCNAALRMLMVGAAAAASFNVLRIVVDGALPSEHPWRQFMTLLLHLRVNVHHGDLNAAGSYFALTWFVAAAYAIRRRITGAICLLLISAGLWTTGSRVALAATLIVGVLLLALRHSDRRRRLIALVIMLTLLAGAAAITWRFLPTRHVADPFLALRIRMGLARGALAMAADHPLFGVGLGNFYELSRSYVHVPNYIVRENAHNNFLQIVAELGVPGACLFVVVLALALVAARNGRTEVTWPVVSGIAAFLLTCLGGHPLLVPHAAIPFWMAAGVAASAQPREPRRAVRIAATALIVVFVATLPSRITAARRNASMENTASGVSRWQRLDDGGRFRWAGGRSTFYVRSSATALTIPLRHGGRTPGPVVVRIYLDGVEANRIELGPDRGWQQVRLLLLRQSNRPWRRVELHAVQPGTLDPIESDASDAGGVLMVGLPEVE
jgi:O-antigen ligase